MPLLDAVCEKVMELDFIRRNLYSNLESWKAHNA